MGSPLGNVFSTVIGTYIGTKLVKHVNNTTWNILQNKSCLSELTGKNSGAEQTCNHRGSRHTPLIVATATDGVSWRHWHQGGISNKGRQIPNHFWKEKIWVDALSYLQCDTNQRVKEAGKKSARCTHRNFQWTNWLHCNLTILPWKLHLCWTSLVFSDIFQSCDMGQSVKQAHQGSQEKSKPFYICFTLGMKKKEVWVTLLQGETYLWCIKNRKRNVVGNWNQNTANETVRVSWHDSLLPSKERCSYGT